MDAFLRDPTLLTTQPKRSIGDYVEAQGIRVPRRFDSIEDATRFGKPFIIRSEHVQDYAGASGLFPSEVVGLKQTFQEAVEKIDRSLSRWDDDRKDGLGANSEPATFLRLTNNTREELLKEVSFSFWEYVQGYNRTIIADDAIEGRYHIFSRGRRTANYVIYDDKKILRSGPWALTPQLTRSLSKDVQFYEKVRSLDRFDSNHCPLVEFQTDRWGRNYFLQYHRGRDIARATFVGVPKQGTKADFVRGATSPEGIVVQILPAIYRKAAYEGEAVFHHEGNPWVVEATARRMKAVITERNFDKVCHLSLDYDHYQRSAMFKPQVFVAGADFLTKQEWGKAFSRETPQPVSIRVISDGTNAVVQRIRTLSTE